MKKRHFWVIVACCTLALMLHLITLSVGAASLFDGKLTIDKGSGNASSYTVSKFGLINQATETITITNNSTSKAKISFNYTFTHTGFVGDGGHTFGDLDTGFIEEVLPPGGTLKYTITTGRAATAKVVLTNITFVELANTSITATYDSNMGSVLVNGVTVSSGGTVGELDPVVNTSLQAIPKAGYEFVGWKRVVDGNEVYYPIAGIYTGQIRENLNLIAIFAPQSSSAMFWVGDTLYTSWQEAMTAVGGSGTIILANSGVLPAGDYVIPNGVTLLIPYNPERTVIKKDQETYRHGTYNTHPERVLYRQLTLEDGADITVQSGGVISVASRAHIQMVGQTGAYGSIKMNEGSKITVQSGGTLYAWGYISHGDAVGGQVLIENGGTVYEHCTLMDYPGSAGDALNIYGGKGSEVANASSNLNGGQAFPMRAYSLRNVEVSMTIAHSAKAYAYYSMYGVEAGENNGYILFAGNESSAIFQLTQDTSTLNISYVSGKNIFKINGNASVNPMAVTVDAVLVQGTITSQKTSGMPLPSGIDVRVLSGTLTLNDNCVMYEGATMYIAQGAFVDTNGKNVYLLDATADPGSVSVTDIHGVQYTNDNTNAYLDVNGTLIASGGFYTTADKADIVSTEKTGVIQFSGTNDKSTVYIKYAANGCSNLDVGPAYLKNADNDNSYTSAAENGTYNYSAEHDRWYNGTHAETATVTPPTCTEKGYTTYSCPCGYSYKDNETAATGHTEAVDAAVAPTCSATGLTEGKHCSVCGTVTVAQTEIPKTAHTSGETVVENNKAPTCGEAGSYDNVTYCTVCGAETSRVTVTVAATGEHTAADAVVENRVEATCGKAGSYDSVVYCSVCSTEMSRTSNTISATGNHTAGEAVVENNKAATCTAEGSYDNVVYCTVCNAELSRDTVTVDKLAHTPAAAVKENEKASTCTVAGSYESVVYCSACDEELSRETKALELAAHTPGETVVENEVAATCTAEGSYDNVVYCTVCNAELSRDTVTVDKIAHTPAAAVEENRVESTCTVAGSYESVVYCSACNTELSRETKALELAAHTPGEAVEENRVESTCTVAGSYESVVYCSVCKTHEISRETKALELAAHTPGEAVVENNKAATCTAEGSYDNVVYCTVCKAELSRETKALELAAHTEGAVVVENEVAATCTAEGSYDNVVYCTVCKAELSRNTVTVDKIVHPPADAVEEKRVESTCTVAGSYESVVYCSACNTELSRETKALELAAHTPADAVKENEKAATCTAEGSYDNVVYCTVCNKELSRNTVKVEKIAHTPAAQ